MTYSEELININNKLCENDSMYSIVLLSAEALTITLSGYRCYLDGKYFICLNSAFKEPKAKEKAVFFLGHST